jgi:hypothetical protein
MAVFGKLCLMKGVESICETWVSILEHHSPATRGIIIQSRLDDECMVAINGPELVNCDDVVKESNASYWSKFKREGDRLGHFVRRSGKILQFDVSKAIDSHTKKPPRLPFMV